MLPVNSLMTLLSNIENQMACLSFHNVAKIISPQIISLLCIISHHELQSKNIMV